MKPIAFILTLLTLWTVFTLSRGGLYYNRGAVPNRDQQRIFDSLLDRKYDFGKCPEKCVLNYFDQVLQQFRFVKMPSDRINLLFQNSFNLMCNPELVQSLPIYPNKKMIMVTGPGSSGTSTANVILAILGYQALHWNHVSLRNNSGGVNLIDEYFPYLRKHVDPSAQYAAAHDYHSITCDRSAESLRPFLNVFRHMDSIADSPVPHLWFELTHIFPDFKLLFTDRRGDWAQKRRNHAPRLDVPFAAKLCDGRVMVVEEFDDAFIQKMLQYFKDLQQCMVPEDRFLAIDIKMESMKPKHNQFWGTVITYLGLENTTNSVLMNNNCRLIKHNGKYGLGEQCTQALCAVGHRNCPSPRAPPVAPFPESTFYL